MKEKLKFLLIPCLLLLIGCVHKQLTFPFEMLEEVTRGNSNKGIVRKTEEIEITELSTFILSIKVCFGNPKICFPLKMSTSSIYMWVYSSEDSDYFYKPTKSHTCTFTNKMIKIFEGANTIQSQLVKDDIVVMDSKYQKCYLE